MGCEVSLQKQRLIKIEFCVYFMFLDYSLLIKSLFIVIAKQILTAEKLRNFDVII